MRYSSMFYWRACNDDKERMRGPGTTHETKTIVKLSFLWTFQANRVHVTA